MSESTKGRGNQARRGGNRPGRPGGAQDEKAAALEKPLRKVLDRLPATQREVLEWRMGLKDGHPHDLADTARQVGLSLSEAREVEKRAFEHIREAVPVQHLAKFLQG